MEEVIPCKVVLIGESGVGKTSIMSRFSSNTFNSSLNSTAGANFTTKQLEIKGFKQQIKFEVWDTAGQEKYRALAKVFYKNSNICIFVYDITRRESFENLKNFWVNEVEVNSSPNMSKSFFY